MVAGWMILALLIPHRSWLCPEVLDLDGEVRSVLVGEVGGGRCFLYKSCFDDLEGVGEGDIQREERELREDGWVAAR